MLEQYKSSSNESISFRQHTTAMDTPPQLEHTILDQTQTSEACQNDMIPTTTSPDLMAFDSKTNLSELTTSATDISTGIEIDIGTDPPTTDHPMERNNDPTNPPTKSTLPVEVWMRILDYIHPEDYARQPVLMVYKTSLALHGDTAAAAQTLPAFEKRSWKLSRTFYRIDRTSRAAALKLKLKLSLRLLRECKPAVLALDNTARVESQLIDGVYNQETKPKPCYVAILVSEQREVLAGYEEAGQVVDCLTGRYDDVVVHSLGLGTAKRIVLLERCDWDSFSMLARAREIEETMHGFWRRNGILGGVVEIA